MEKNFDNWNKIKKRINDRNISLYSNSREIWWCSVGINVGSEVDGKNNLFERPVLILGIFNKEIVRIVPLTSKLKNDRHHVIISYNNRQGTAILSQLKTISSKRLSRKLCRLDKIQFNEVLLRIKDSI